MKTIGTSAFASCEKLTSLTLPEGLTSIGASSFWDCRMLPGIIIPSTLTTIPGGAFEKCASFTSLLIPDNITTLESSSFSDCLSLTTVAIGEGTTTIGSFAFRNCPLLEDLSVSPTNPAFTVLDGVLYSKDLTTLIRYPPNKPGTDFTIPSAVSTVSSFSFQFARNLTQLVLNEGLENVFTGAFANLELLTEITIPANVTVMARSAFTRSNSLTSIHVDPANPEFSSIAGVLFNKNQTSLISYPSGKPDLTYQIPEDTITVGDAAFSGSSTVEHDGFSLWASGSCSRVMT